MDVKGKIAHLCEQLHEQRSYVACALVPALSVGVSVPALASSSTVVDSTSWSEIITDITNQVSVTTIAGVLASVTVVCIGLVFFWWGLRKVVKMIMRAFRGGKMSV